MTWMAEGKIKTAGSGTARASDVRSLEERMCKIDDALRTIASAMISMSTTRNVNGRVWAPGKNFMKRTLKTQRLTEGAWITVDKEILK